MKTYMYNGGIMLCNIQEKAFFFSYMNIQIRFTANATVGFVKLLVVQCGGDHTLH